MFNWLIAIINSTKTQFVVNYDYQKSKWQNVIS